MFNLKVPNPDDISTIIMIKQHTILYTSIIKVINPTVNHHNTPFTQKPASVVHKVECPLRDREVTGLFPGCDTPKVQ